MYAQFTLKQCRFVAMQADSLINSFDVLLFILTKYVTNACVKTNTSDYTYDSTQMYFVDKILLLIISISIPI